MTATLAKKVAARIEHTGTASGDRAQALSRQNTQAHELTRLVVAALINSAYVALAADTTIAVAAYATLLSAAITTTLASGFLVITWSAAAGNASACSVFYQVLVDGVVTKGCRSDIAAGGGAVSSMVIRVPVTRGAHTVALQWKTNVANAHINAKTVVEEHAHLLVQERP